MQPNADLMRSIGMQTLRNILVVEDECLIAMDLEMKLSAAGFSVIGPASHVASSLSLIQSHKIDVALLDVDLGQGENSLPIAAELTRRGIPILFHTGRRAFTDLLTQFAGARQIYKPADFCKLKGHLEALLAEAAETSQSRVD